MSCPYSEALAMRPAVSYIPYATSYHEQTGNIITFAQFEEGNLALKNLIHKNMNKFCLQLMSYLQTMILMTDV